MNILTGWYKSIKVARVDRWWRSVAEVEEHTNETLKPAVDGQDLTNTRRCARQVGEVSQRVVEG